MPTVPPAPDRPPARDQPGGGEARAASAPLVQEVERELHRVAGRLRALPLEQLRIPVPGAPSRAAAARRVAQALADAAAELEHHPLPAARNDPAPHREVPVLHDFATADQLVVTGTDLILAAGLAPPRAAADVELALQGALTQLRHLRALL